MLFIKYAPSKGVVGGGKGEEEGRQVGKMGGGKEADREEMRCCNRCICVNVSIVQGHSKGRGSWGACEPNLGDFFIF